MITAQVFFKKAYLAIILLVAALVFPLNTWAASGNVQSCQPNTSCVIGEFLYNDSYSPLTTATCSLTSRYPDGSLFLNAVNMPVSSQGDGWYAYTFTTPTTLGVYRSEVKCIVGSDTMALDKSFEVKTAESTLSSSDVTSAVWNASRSSYTGSGTFGEALQNIAPSASSVASATWGYTDRTLSSFGSLVSSVWSNTARTLTQETTTTTNITSTNVVEQLLNKPNVEILLEESSVTTIDLQTKLDKSDEMANQLLTSATYIRSKANLIKGRGGDFSKTLSQLETVADSMNKEIDWIADQWNLPISSKLQSQNQKVVLALKQGRNILTNIDAFLKLIGNSNDTPKSATLFGQLQGKKELSSALNKNYTAASALLPNFGKDSKPSADQIAQINVLGAQIAAINQLPKMNKNILSQASTKMDQKQLKNKTLSLRGIVGANKQFLAQKPGQPLRSIWFEEGSIVFKTLISNPSKLISQKIPLKYYLPKEVIRENIIKIDEELTINYDSEKDQFYISGSFTLGPGETKTLTVTVDDSVFHINDAEILTMRKQVEELSKHLEHTAYFTQGVTLKTDIDASLDKVESLQKNGTTPELTIRGYREAQIEYKAAKEKLEKLKEITANAGSVGMIFSFMGGAQVLAVWGLIVITIAVFVSLSLYMRTVKSKEVPLTVKERQPLPITEDEFTGKDDQAETIPVSVPKRFYLGKPFKVVSVLIAAALIGGSSLYAVRSAQVNKQQPSVMNTPSVLGTEIKQASPSAKVNQDSYIDISIFVPVDSMVTVQSEPSINSPVLTSLSLPTKAKEIKRQDNWVKVVLQDTAGKDIEGWVDEDFVEAETKKINDAALPKPVKSIVVQDTPTGFLRVRQSPWGQEITKAFPEESYLLVEEDGDWYKIELDDGSIGWIHKSYANVL